MLCGYVAGLVSCRLDPPGHHGRLVYSGLCFAHSVPDVSMMGINKLVTTFTTCGRSTGYLVCGAQFTRGGGFCSSTLRQLGRYSVAEREERLFTNRSNQPGDDMKDEVRTDDDWHAWRIWSNNQGPFRAATSAWSPIAVSL